MISRLAIMVYTDPKFDDDAKALGNEFGEILRQGEEENGV